jgi:cytochrome bd-type quinol oxidase subunit 2
MVLFIIACVWTLLSVAEVAERWLSSPGSLLFVAVAIVLVALSIAFWRSIWTRKVARGCCSCLSP